MGGSESQRNIRRERIKEKYSINIEGIILRSNTAHSVIH